MRRIAVLLLLAIPLACSSDGGDETGDPGCEVWEDVRDAPTVEDMDEVAEVTELREVRMNALTIRARLEADGDLVSAPTLMDDLCES